MPEINDRYPGTIGRTQGEIKDKIPKRNAVNMLTFVSTIRPSRNVFDYEVIIRMVCVRYLSRQQEKVPKHRRLSDTSRVIIP
jgi:hypothetical protein